MRSTASPTIAFIHQEMIEILYHTLWETVHVFLEHRELGHDVGAAGFLYPFLVRKNRIPVDLLAEVAASIQMKVRDDSAAAIAGRTRSNPNRSARPPPAMHERLARGGKLILFGNGGSATDCNDWALDCVTATGGLSSRFRLFL